MAVAGRSLGIVEPNPSYDDESARSDAKAELQAYSSRIMSGTC